ncbi:Isochorismatase hydrolase [Ophiobolus disseminans]|uniref:Isochorismatase hydrolase n=1 Tax=Ophiobolus disseminans TaxID=1469910 RepID=A0A6A7A6L7_9PLEO|nr:Isochorismatase hydrolase [Ophiobolus disseminans]
MVVIPEAQTADHPKVIGGAENFWLYSETEGYDITHPASPDAPKIYPRMTLKTDSSRVVIAPARTALVIIDLQNYFLSPAFKRPSESRGLRVVERLINEAIPACRKAGIPILWLGWGLTHDDIESMPPAMIHDYKIPELGVDIGPVQLDDGSTVDGSKVLMRDQWNSEFYAWKNRLSGFWGGTEVEDILKRRGIRTLMFAGCNTDQCVASSLMDAVWRNWDCILLSDATATTSPQFAQNEVEYNMEGWGFKLTCKDLVDGINTLKTSQDTEL